MSTPVRPSTPIAQSAPSTPQTGTWRHPKLDEIVKRRDATNFSDRNLKNIFYNLGGIFMAFYGAELLRNNLPNLFPHQYTTYGYWLIQFVFVYNIIVACLPLFRTIDDISDIPLTPAQRKLLGLAPNSTPPTPGSQYITPPRYARTPSSGSPINKETLSRSPSIQKGGSTMGGMTGSFSISSGPMLQKVIGGSINGNRRNSYGSPSPLGPYVSRMNIPETPSTPTPGVTKGTNVGLNSKWLYERGRRSSGSAHLFT